MIILLKIIFVLYFSYMAYSYTEKINLLTHQHCNGIRAGHSLKRAGAVAAVLAIICASSFAFWCAIVMIPLGMLILNSRQVRDHYKWMKSQGINSTIID